MGIILNTSVSTLFDLCLGPLHTDCCEFEERPPLQNQSYEGTTITILVVTVLLVAIIWIAIEG